MLSAALHCVWYCPTPVTLSLIPVKQKQSNIRHLIPYPLQCSISYLNGRSKAPALDPTPLPLQSIPHPCTLKQNFKAPPPLRHCSSTSCSFSPVASLATSLHSDSSPCSRSTPPPAPPPVTTSSSLSLFRFSRHFPLHNRRLHHQDLLCCPSPEPPRSCVCVLVAATVCAHAVCHRMLAYVPICVCVDTVCSCCVSPYARVRPDMCVC
jgi:hypothetical protein